MFLAKRFIRFVAPSVLSMWIFSLYSMVDGFFVSHGVGGHALAAVNLSMPYINTVFAIGLILAVGSSTVLSIALGQKDQKLANDCFNQNLVVVALVCSAVSVLTLLNLDGVARFLGSTAPTHGYVREYVGTLAPFMPFFAVSYNLEVQVKAANAPQVSAVGVVSCALTNVLLDYLFVMRFGWGVAGAAAATGIAQVVSTIIFFLFFLRGKAMLRFGRFTPRPELYRRILPLGLADGMTEFSNAIVIFTFNQVILRVIGEGALISYTIISYLNTLVLMTMSGISQGIQPLVSFYHGAGEPRYCEVLRQYGLLTAAVCSVLFLIFSQAAPQLLVGFFLDGSDPALFDSSVQALRLYSLCFLLLGFNVIWAGYFTAIEQPFRSLTISMGRACVLPLPCLVFLPMLAGESGVWLAPLASEGICLLLACFLIRRYRREQARQAAPHLAP